MYSGQFGLLAQKDKENKKDGGIPSSPPHLFRRQKNHKKQGLCKAKKRILLVKNFLQLVGILLHRNVFIVFF
jgi:hypothetical protein